MQPCIRGLREFKRGCPRSDECPCWKVSFVVEHGERVNKGQCIDLWRFDHERAILALLEGNQQAIESFRNNTYNSAEKLVEVMNASLQVRHLRDIQGGRVTKVISDSPDNG